MPREQHKHASVPTVTSRPAQELSRVTSDIQQQLDVTFPTAFFLLPLRKSQQKQVVTESF